MYNHKQNDDIEPIISEDLFLDNSQPNQEDIPATTKNEIEEFFDINYEQIGYRNAYQMPKSVIMEKYISVMKSKFQFILSKEIDKLQVERQKTISLLNQAKNVSIDLENDIKSALTFQETKIQNLNNEKERTSLDEGLIMRAINAYTLGFNNGLHQYTEELLIVTNSGLFQDNKFTLHA